MTGARWPGRAAAEHLLDGGDADTPLGRVLAHARGPAGPHELLGEHEAAAMFRAGGGAPLSARTRRTLSRLLAVKVAVAAALLAGSGLAVASATGTLPIPARDTPRPAPAVPPRPAPTTDVRDQQHAPADTPRTPGPPSAAVPSPVESTGRGKGPDEHARSPHPRGNSAHPTPARKNDNTPNPPGGKDR